MCISMSFFLGITLVHLFQAYSRHDQDIVPTVSLMNSPLLGSLSVVPACTLFTVFNPVRPVVPFVASGIGLCLALLSLVMQQFML